MLPSAFDIAAALQIHQATQALAHQQQEHELQSDELTMSCESAKNCDLEIDVP